ncbi:MAG: tetratricopeptide repeat protein [Elusimicrobia bacterium]|nr:tetratricopeptide repeat protein [Elusimicrobiota bacterium]
MKPLWAALAVLLLPLNARAYYNDGNPDCNDEGFDRTSAVCADPNSPLCQKRLAKTIAKCQGKLNHKGDDPAVIQQRIDKLKQIQGSQTSAVPTAADSPGPGGAGAVKGGGRSGGGAAGSTGGDGQTPAADTITKGKAALQAGDTKGALAAANEVLADDPKNLEALQLRAQAKFASGDKAGAAEDAKAMLAIDKDNEFAHIVLDGGKDVGDGAIQRALRQPNFGASRDAGGAAGGARRLGELGGRTARPTSTTASSGPSTQDAAASAKVVLTAQSPAAGLVHAAESTLRMRDLSGAFDGATRAIAADPKNARTWALRAMVLNQIGKPESALKDADEALRLDPANVAALLERGYAKYQLGQYQDALKDVEKALALDPLNAMGYLYKAMILEKLDRVKDAISSYMKAAQFDPSLKPLVDEALARLGVASGASGKAGPAARSPRELALLGAALLAALALLFLGAKRLIKPEWATPITPYR